MPQEVCQGSHYVKEESSKKLNDFLAVDVLHVHTLIVKEHHGSVVKMEKYAALPDSKFGGHSQKQTKRV